ncbi:Ubiquitin carboxyl-terminal hydrolase, family 1 domain containing protein [Amanita muscaria]
MSADDESSGWQLTESDPGVFTELLKTLGVPLVVDDLYSLDSEALAALKPLRAFIFLFKWLPTSQNESAPQSGGEYDVDFPGFFAHQVVNNACATLAVLNALGNIPSLTAGAQLTELLSFSAGLDAQTRGLVITSSDWLREAHNALSPPHAISLDGLGLPKRAEDAYHFVVYLPVMGALYEFDGLKQYPVKHGHCGDPDEWVTKAREVIETRIGTYPEGSLEFSLLALHDDPLPLYQTQIEHMQRVGDSTGAAELMSKIANESSKRERWAFENSLRRHNHVGFVHALLSALAKADKLSAAQESAKKVMKNRIETRRKKGESMEED